MGTLARKCHLLGAKLRTVRKHNGLTLEELSARVFQRPDAWFLDDKPEPDAAELRTGTRSGARPPRTSGARAVPLEPAFLFSRDLLQAAIPELLAQTGTTGRQFAHLLIRSHQELSRNDFSDLERAAEGIGARQFPLGVEDLQRLYRRQGLKLRWFDRPPLLARDKDREVCSVVRSFYEAPHMVYLNRELQGDIARLKFDLAAHLGHKVLHGGDGLKTVHATGGEMGGSPESGASALLCPKIPFRRFLSSERYRVEAGRKIDLTPAVVMRRMTKVSPYPHGHFFDAYPPGYLRAVYRGNDIPLPWGNMAQVTDPCPHWAVFRMLNERQERSTQISVLRDGRRSILYCCHSIRTHDMARNPHVLSVGIDLMPAMSANGIDAAEQVAQVSAACLANCGQAAIPPGAARAIATIARVLNIAWLEDALANPASIICPRSTNCQRAEACTGSSFSQAREIADVRNEIVRRPAQR